MALDREKISHIIMTITDGYLSWKYWKDELSLLEKVSKKDLQVLLQEVQNRLPCILKEERFKIHWQMSCFETFLISKIKKAS